MHISHALTSSKAFFPLFFFFASPEIALLSQFVPENIVQYYETEVFHTPFDVPRLYITILEFV